MSKSEEQEKIESLVFQAIGEASMCWYETPKGIFDSVRAKEIGDKLIEKIKHQINWAKVWLDYWSNEKRMALFHEPLIQQLVEAQLRGEE